MAEWSYRLLTTEEQFVFRRLAVFTGSFSLEAAVAVAQTEHGDHWETVDALGRLIDKSLIAVEAGEPLRYRLLETLRFFAIERLRENGESEAISARHARNVADELLRASDAWESTADEDWIATYSPLLDDARAALKWSLAQPAETNLTISLIASINLLLHNLGLNGEGLRNYNLGLRFVGAQTPPYLAARLFRAAAWYGMDLATRVEFGRQAAEFFRQANDSLNRAAIMASIGGHLTFLGRFDEAEEALTQARIMLSNSRYYRPLAIAMDHSGLLASLMGNPQKAKRCYNEALALTRKWRLSSAENNILMHSAALDFRLGDLDGAIERARLVESRIKPGYPQPPHVWPTLGSYLALRGDLSEARLFAERFSPVANESVENLVRLYLSLWAFIGASEGRCAGAARIAGFVEAGLAKSGAEHVLPVRRAIDERVKEMIEAQLDTPTLTALLAEGAGWSRTEAIAFAREHLAAPR